MTRPLNASCPGCCSLKWLTATKLKPMHLLPIPPMASRSNNVDSKVSGICCTVSCQEYVHIFPYKGFVFCELHQDFLSCPIQFFHKSIAMKTNVHKPAPLGARPPGIALRHHGLRLPGPNRQREQIRKILGRMLTPKCGTLTITAKIIKPSCSCTNSLSASMKGRSLGF